MDMSAGRLLSRSARALSSSGGSVILAEAMLVEYSFECNGKTGSSWKFRLDQSNIWPYSSARCRSLW